MLVFANEDVGRQLDLFGSYEQEEVNFFNKHVKADDICLDIGGNVGYFSLIFSKLAHKGMVYTFEPIKLNAEIIRLNKLLNNIDNILINEIAVSNKEGIVNFSKSKDSAFSSLIDTGRVEIDSIISVQELPLDIFIKNNNISKVDIIKIDVEGAEGLVISGAKHLFSNKHLRPRYILMELYQPNLSFFNESIPKILLNMNNFNYSPFIIDKKSLELISYDLSKHKNFYNVMFVDGDLVNDN